MPRTSKKTKEAEEQKVPEMESNTVQESVIVEEHEVPETEVSPEVDKLMQLYPQYEQIYITKDGFVHPFGAPQYLIADAILYTNKYFNNK